ncbi:tigger transposable element-derived protein 6-like [Octopus sinensis]|uniref:Tigger transposable element-derived protein 6-like n=1 Tax=Octopus sinensis TaxID=2607531 RepID=A0A6P7U5N0_9MOLL|nr:tigger transposable element-derived protein 6-like [Octopus sinensis]
MVNILKILDQVDKDDFINHEFTEIDEIEDYLNIAGDSFSQKYDNEDTHNDQSHFNEIDEDTMSWIEMMETRGAFLNDSIILTKAEDFAKKRQITEFKASRGWLEKFKRRHGLKLKKLYGESYTENFSNSEVNDFLINIRVKIKLYGRENVYNADETGLFYKALPCKSICKIKRYGHKLLKD